MSANKDIGFKYTLKRQKRILGITVTISKAGVVKIRVPKLFDNDYAATFITAMIPRIRNAIKKKKWRFATIISDRDVPMLKERAMRLAQKGCSRFAKLYCVQYTKIVVSGYKTKWGGCREDGVLYFSYKIALLPTRLVNYVFAHEICHLLDMRHSNSFWNQVSRTFPNHKAMRKRLDETIHFHTS